MVEKYQQPLEQNAYKRYLYCLGLLWLFAAGAVVAVNYVVDPVGAYHARFDETPYPKPLFQRHLRMAKAHTVRQLQPDAIILGTSRVEIGYSPTHPDWGTERVYNLGLPHATMDEVRAYFLHAASTENLKTVVLALDFFQFNPILEPRPDFENCRLLQPDSLLSKWVSPLCDVPYTLLSRQVLRQSIGMFADGDNTPRYAYNGFRLSEGQSALLNLHQTQRDAFRFTEHHYARTEDLYGGFLKSRARGEAGLTNNQAFAALDDIFETAIEQNIDLRIVFSPSHSRLWELLDAIGLWGEFNDWKREIVRIADAHSQQSGREMFPIWDFAYYHEYAQEAVSEAQFPQTRMRWHWDSSHFTSALGDLVLSEVLADVPPGKFGRLLRPQMIDAWIAEIERGQREYRHTNPKEHQKFNRDFEQYTAQLVAHQPTT